MLHVAIGSDHAGHEMKKYVIALLKEQKVSIKDHGGNGQDEEDDYPDYVEKVCEDVLKDPAKRAGILLCGSGVGVCIGANRYKGIRAVLGWNVETAYLSRKDDHSNVLCLGGNTMTMEQVEAVLHTWMTTPRSPAERHERRVKKLDKLGQMIGQIKNE